MQAQRCTTRWLVAVALTAIGCLGVSMPVQAQKTSLSQGWQFNLGLPQRTQAALARNEGMSWDQFRSVGLTLSARGAGEFAVLVTVLSVQDGRVNGRWESRGFTAPSGERPVPDAYLPRAGDRTLPSLGRVAQVLSASRPMRAEDLAHLGSDASRILPPAMARGSVLMVFVAPTGGGSGSSTTPLFVKTILNGD